jgi:hypothetical protein
MHISSRLPANSALLTDFAASRSTQRGKTRTLGVTVRIAKLITRWLAILSLSLLVTLPLVIGITALGTHIDVETYYEKYGRPPVGEDDLGVGFVGLSALVVYSVGSFVVIWPFALWGSHKIFRRRVGQQKAVQS